MTQNYRRPLALMTGGMSLMDYMGKSVEELQEILSNAAGTMKCFMGVINNSAYYTMLDAIDAFKKTKRYRHETKRCLNNVLARWAEYENRLVYSETERFFCVADMPENTRKKYGDITNREYYEYWKAGGGEGYMKVKNLVLSLRHKYYKSLLHHGCKEEDAQGLSYLMAQMAMFEACCSAWVTVVYTCSQASGVPLSTLKTIFDCFRLDKIRDHWKLALFKAGPEITWDLEEEEERNIQLGIDDLFEKLADVEFIYSCQQDAMEVYEEVFRTKGEWKKAQRLFAEAKAELINEVS